MEVVKCSRLERKQAQECTHMHTHAHTTHTDAHTGGSKQMWLAWSRPFFSHCRSLTDGNEEEVDEGCASHHGQCLYIYYTYFFSQVIIYLIVLCSRYRFYHSGEMSLFLMCRWHHKERFLHWLNCFWNAGMFFSLFCSPLFLSELKFVVLWCVFLLHCTVWPPLPLPALRVIFPFSSRNWSTLYIYNGFCIIWQQSALCTRSKKRDGCRKKTGEGKLAQSSFFPFILLKFHLFICIILYSFHPSFDPLNCTVTFYKHPRPWSS